MRTSYIEHVNYCFQIGLSVQFFSVYAVVLLISTSIEVDYLISDYYPLSMRANNEDEMERHFLQSPIATRNFTWYCVLFTSILKIMSFFDLALHSRSGKMLMKRLWSKTQYFIPPLFFQIPVPTELVINLENRIIALTWLQFISSVTLFTLVIINHFKLRWSVHLNTAKFVLPLKLLMLVKSFTGFIFIISVLHDSYLPDVFAEFGCSIHCINFCRANRRTNLAIDVSRPTKLRVDKKMLRRNSGLKFIDLLVSVPLWQTLIWAHRLGGRYKPKEVRVFLGILSIILFVIDIILPIHGLVISSW